MKTRPELLDAYCKNVQKETVLKSEIAQNDCECYLFVSENIKKEWFFRDKSRPVEILGLSGDSHVIYKYEGELNHQKVSTFILNFEF